jgi:peptide/nickel transport system ATP-binding protein
VPNPIDPPPGCPFHPRCPFANERCRTEVPRLIHVEDARVACHGIEERRIPEADVERIKVRATA